MIKKNIISIIIILLCFFSFIGLSQDFQDIKAYTTSNEILKKVLNSKDNKNYKNFIPNKKLANDFFKQKSRNKDTIGFMSINKVAYYPVMFSNDNTYYLKHDKNKKKSNLGAIFMNKESKGNFNNMALLHGHRMKSGKMFGSLARYENTKFFTKNKPIEIFDGKYFYYYKPYTIFLIKDGKEYINQDKNINDKRIKYFKSLHERSEIKNNIKLNYSEQMLYLSTCDYDFQDARMILGSYLLAKVPYNGHDK